MNKIALVTGASAGIGEATARALIDAGYTVFAAARRLDRMSGLAALGATLLKLDVTDDASMVAAVEAIKTSAGRLDVLVNNAGYGSYGALEDVPLDEARRQFEVNVFGCWGLIQALLPLLLAAPAARIVNVSSAAAQQIGKLDTARVFSPAHSLAKFTLNALTTTLAAALAETPILINAVDPGRVATHPERGDDADDRSPAEAAKGVIWAATLDRGGPTGGLFVDGKPVSEGAPVPSV